MADDDEMQEAPTEITRVTRSAGARKNKSGGVKKLLSNSAALKVGILATAIENTAIENEVASNTVEKLQKPNGDLDALAAQLSALDIAIDKKTANYSDDMLIGVPNSEKPNEVDFLRVEEYKAKYSDQASKKDLDARCILFKDENGNFLPKPQLYYQPKDRSLSSEDLQRVRKELFANKVKEFGVSTKTFASIQSSKENGGSKEYDTPGGKRNQKFDYTNPLQAGKHNPDVLIKRDGVYVGVYRSLDQDLKGKQFDQLLKDHGGNVHFKSTDHIYQRPEYLIEKYGERAAADRWAGFNGERLRYNKTLPSMIVEVDKKFFSAELLLNHRPNADVSRLLSAGSNELTVLMLTKGGKAYVSPSFLKDSDPNHFADTRNKLNVPDTIAKKRWVAGEDGSMKLVKPAVPDVMVQVNPSQLASSKDVPRKNGISLKDQYGEERIFAKSMNAKGSPTGNMKILPEIDKPGNAISKHIADEIGIEPREVVREGAAKDAIQIDGSSNPKPMPREYNQRDRNRGPDVHGV